MNKYEFYNKVVEIYRKTGQGVPKFVADRAGNDIFEDLEKEGLVKLVVTPYNHLPDDQVICLTKGYCVEEDTRDHNLNALHNIRIYLNLESIIDLGKALQVTLKDAIQNPDMMKDYSEWLIKNKSKLEEKIELLDESILPDELSDETVEYLKTRAWYKENLNVSECLSRMKDWDKDASKLIQSYDEIIKLKSLNKEKYKDSLAENIKEKDELIYNEKYRTRIRKWLSTKDSKEKIQSLI